MNRKTFAVMMMVAATSMAMAGPLNPPPGPIASTMKTLAEVEPRIAINATNTPGNANAMFVISQSGSYYLTGDVNVDANKSGILVNMPNVTIDLNGYRIRGFANSRYGVYANALDSIVIRNGRIAQMGMDGVRSETGGTFAQGNVIEDLTVQDCALSGIVMTSGRVLNCMANRNGGDGIYVGGFSGSTVENCVANGNSVAGIVCYSGVVNTCSAIDNTVIGILVENAVVSNCSVKGGVTGIESESGTIVDSMVKDTTGVGIAATGECLVRGNSITSSSFVANTIGIKVQYTNGAKVQDNQITRMATGISSLTSSHYIVNNTLRGCTAAMNVAAGSRVGTIVTGTSSGAINGNTGGGMGTTDPYANILY